MFSTHTPITGKLRTKMIPINYLERQFSFQTIKVIESYTHLFSCKERKKGKTWMNSTAVSRVHG